MMHRRYTENIIKYRDTATKLQCDRYGQHVWEKSVECQYDVTKE